MISAKGRLFGGNTYEMGREIQACSFCGLSPMLGWALGWHICILPTHVPENRPCLGFCKRLQETHWLTELVFDGIVSLVCCWCSVGVNWCLFTVLAEHLPQLRVEVPFWPLIHVSFTILSACTPEPTVQTSHSLIMFCLGFDQGHSRAQVLTVMFPPFPFLTFALPYCILFLSMPETSDLLLLLLTVIFREM